MSTVTGGRTVLAESRAMARGLAALRIFFAPILVFERAREALRHQQLLLQVGYLSSGRFMWEQPHEWVPLVILAPIPAGRIWGFDARLLDRGGRRFDRWPF